MLTEKNGFSGAIDAHTLKTLLKKQFDESRSGFKDKKFDKLGFLLKIFILAGFIASFVFLFSRFSDVYFSVKLYGVTDYSQRAFELLTITYQILTVLTVISAVAQINYALFHDEENMLFSAMPVSSGTLYSSKLIVVYLRQLLVCLLFVFTVNITFAAKLHQGAWYYFATILMTAFLPFVSIAIASFIVLPLRKIIYFFRDKFVLSFVASTVILALGFVLYYYVLTAVKQVLMGDDLRYFFDEKVMNDIAAVTKALYPANLFAGFVLGRQILKNGLISLAIVAVCIAVSALMIKLLFTNAMQNKANGVKKFAKKAKAVPAQRSVGFALLKKEFLTIFRTSSYTFSYFSVAIVMPLMVYFCLSLADSMVRSLVGVNTSLELSIVLTLLFGALTNTFCATNISRDGMMFYSVKAMPVSAKTVMFSKVLLCLLIACISNMLNAVIICATGYVSFGQCLLVTFVGIAIAFAQICFATRADLNRPHFPQDESGEIKQSGDLVSQIIVIGLLSVFVFGGLLLYVRVASDLRGTDLDVLTWIISAVTAAVSATLFYYYLVRKLKQKYYETSGGY